MTRIELYCRSEKLVVAEVEIESEIDAKSIRSGLTKMDSERCPEKKKIEDGATLLCKKCKNSLYIRGAARHEILAVVGQWKVADGAA